MWSQKIKTTREILASVPGGKFFLVPFGQETCFPAGTGNHVFQTKAAPAKNTNTKVSGTGQSPSKVKSPSRKRTLKKEYISPTKLHDLTPFTIGRTSRVDNITIPSPTPSRKIDRTVHSRGSSVPIDDTHTETITIPSRTPTPSRYPGPSPSPREEIIVILTSSPTSPSPVRNVERGGWTDSDSEELPSPRRMLQFLKTPKSATKRDVGEDLRKWGGFRESLGGTLHEVEDSQGIVFMSRK